MCMYTFSVLNLCGGVKGTRLLLPIAGAGEGQVWDWVLVVRHAVAMSARLFEFIHKAKYIKQHNSKAHTLYILR